VATPYENVRHDGDDSYLDVPGCYGRLKLRTEAIKEKATAASTINLTVSLDRTHT
jgi:hypothetical protein